MKRPTGPTSTKANLDGEIIQLNPSKHCWRPRQTLAWPTRFTRGPFPTPLPHNFPFPANVYTRSIALSITGTSQLWPLDNFRNASTISPMTITPRTLSQYANHQLSRRMYAKLNVCVVCVCICKCVRACTSVNVQLCVHLSTCEYRHMYYVPIYMYYFMPQAY